MLSGELRHRHARFYSLDREPTLMVQPLTPFVSSTNSDTIGTTMTSNHPIDDDLPSLEDMRDTLTFMWDYFFQQMVDEWLKAPGSGYKTTWSNARVQMRYRTLTNHAGGTSDFVELKIAAQDGSFSAQGTFHAERNDAKAPQPVMWTCDGDYEEFVAWMVPWVSNHVMEGGGWIDLP
jgi:hypothetical protein